MIIYLAGKMTGCDNFNYPAFHEYARRLRAKGHVVRNPAEEFGGAQDRKRSEYMIRANERIMRFGAADELCSTAYQRADAIALLPLPDRDAWRSSDGAHFEMHLALIHDLPVYYADDLERGDASPLDRQVIRDFVNPPSNRGGGKVTPINHDTTDPRGTIMVDGGIQPHERDGLLKVGDRVRDVFNDGEANGVIVAVSDWAYHVRRDDGVDGTSDLVPGAWTGSYEDWVLDTTPQAAMAHVCKTATCKEPGTHYLGVAGMPATGEVRVVGADPHEVRVVDPKTGGEKGMKLARYGLVPMRAWDVVRKTAMRWSDPSVMSSRTWAECALSELDNFIERSRDDRAALAEAGGCIANAMGGDQQALDALADVYGYGAQKYANRNWERGYAWELSISACYRHLRAHQHLIDQRDPESKLPHLAHALFHVLALLTFLEYNLGTDDRSELYKGGA